MNLYLLAIGLAVIAAFADVVGGCLTMMKKQASKQTLLYFTALAAGFILSAAILDRVPEAMEKNPHGALYILIGFLVLYLIENLFSIHAHSQEEVESKAGYTEHGHSLVGRQICDGDCLISPTASYAAIVGLVIHTFFDGVAIAAGFSMGIHTGVLMFLAVIFHKLPEGFSASSLMLASDQSRNVAFSSAVLLGISTIAGAVFAYFVSHGNETIARVLLTLATGSFLYIGASDLIPATSAGRNKVSVLFVILGVILFYISLKILEMAGFSV
ncbi:MAG: ZIP family metal transporter [Firmicutes bacterium]|nr:ZIP family metal transporter [Bacillota bacterium]